MKIYANNKNVHVNLSDYASKEELENCQSKTDETLPTKDKTISGAIKELFQNANNGKQLIANAIGEPVSANDTFSAMSNDINSLLNTFKTNMMNNGIAVASGDKFKSLIDKIATMVEEGSSKGIQYASGTKTDFDVSDEYFNGVTTVVDMDIEFTPDIVFFTCESISSNRLSTITDITVSSSISNSSDTNAIFRGTTGNSVVMYITNISSTSFDLCSKGTISFTGMIWHAIGVGEEDTTLRDSLASILTEEGVDVTEKDDMASLISKIDEEFDKKNANSGLNIISATELPATGKENQMCIINENSGSFLVTSNNSDDNPGGFKVLLGSAKHYPIIPVTVNNITENYRIQKVFYDSTQLDSYYWNNNEWTRVSAAKLMAYNNGSFPNEDIIGVLSSNQYVEQTSERLECRTDPRGDWSDGFISFTKPIDFNVYNTITFQARSSGDSHPLEFGLSTAPLNTYSTGKPSEIIADVASASVDTSNSTYTVNISSFSGTGYLTIIIPSVQRFNYYYIYSIELS